jgi:3-oxoacid CoA-transferase B subunit
MDLVASAQRIIVAMQHANKAGQSKILTQCTLPLTGVGCVTKVVTDLAVLERITDGSVAGYRLLERAPGISVEEIVAKTEAHLVLPKVVPEMRLLDTLLPA